ncbi:hypothetical protein BLOT_000588, partial [Blomia tropicalis]
MFSIHPNELIELNETNVFFFIHRGCRQHRRSFIPNFYHINALNIHDIIAYINGYGTFCLSHMHALYAFVIAIIWPQPLW